MNSNNQLIKRITQSTPFFWILFTLFSIEIISFGASQFTLVNDIGFVIILVIALVLSIINLRWGVLLLLAELFIGSKGYLFSMQVNGFNLSIRLALFLVVFFAYLFWIARDRKIHFFKFKYWKQYTALVIVIVLASLLGFLNSHAFETIFIDVNGFLFLGLIGPLTQAFSKKEHTDQILSIFVASLILIIVKTVILLFIFSQLDFFAYTLPEIYKWIRDAGIGEITRFPNGFSRIFFQNHIYTLIGFFFFVVYFFSILLRKGKIEIKSKIELILLIGIATTLLTIFLSYSRSFWVATAFTLALLFLWYLIIQKVSFKKIVLLAVILFGVFIADYVIAFGIVNIPLPGHQTISASSLLTERTKGISDEPAASSRMQLLKPLVEASLEQPFIGQGFGATLTYQSSDPRILEENSDGMYTTHAFEWGYLSFLYKFGLIGLAIYGWLYISLLIYGYRQWKINKNTQNLALMCGLVALAVTHFFTPYLDHPLGIGWVMVSSIIFVNTQDE